MSVASWRIVAFIVLQAAGGCQNGLASIMPTTVTVPTTMTTNTGTGTGLAGLGLAQQIPTISVLTGRRRKREQTVRINQTETRTIVKPESEAIEQEETGDDQAKLTRRRRYDPEMIKKNFRFGDNPTAYLMNWPIIPQVSEASPRRPIVFKAKETRHKGSRNSSTISQSKGRTINKNYTPSSIEIKNHKKSKSRHGKGKHRKVATESERKRLQTRMHSGLIHNERMMEA